MGVDMLKTLEMKKYLLAHTRAHIFPSLFLFLTRLMTSLLTSMIRLVYEGIPNDFRARMWQICSGSIYRLKSKSCSGLYQSLFEKVPSSSSSSFAFVFLQAKPQRLGTSSKASSPSPRSRSRRTCIDPSTIPSTSTCCVYSAAVQLSLPLDDCTNSSITSALDLGREEPGSMPCGECSLPTPGTIPTSVPSSFIILLSILVLMMMMVKGTANR